MTGEDLARYIWWTDGGSVAHYFDDCPALRLATSRGRRVRRTEWRDLPPLNFCRMCIRLDRRGHSDRIKAREAKAARGGGAG